MSIVLSLRHHHKGKPILRGNDHFWSVIMDRHRDGKAFTQRDIAKVSNANPSNIRDFIRCLEAARLIEIANDAPVYADVEYRALVVQSTAPRVRRDGTVIESQSANRCMWNLMRGPMGRSGFTYLDLVRWSRTDETEISPNSAKTYIIWLNKAGYLFQLDGSKPGTPATWRLDPKMDTGPQAPMILRTKLVFDPNRQEVFGPAEAEEVHP